MGRIVVHQNMSLDGVTQDPTGDEGFDRGGWFAAMPAHDRDEWAKVEYEEALATSAWLIGRRTYEWFARRWADREGAWADRLREIPKYVLSSTLEAADEWANSIPLSGDPIAVASKVRQDVEGDVLVYGSRPLVQTLLDNGLVDELRLMMYPVVLGAGQRLFTETAQKHDLKVVDVRRIGESLVLLTYAEADAAA